MAIRIKRGTAAQWTSQNPVLLDGQPGWERDTGRMKVGDGVTAWNSLGYTANAGGSAGFRGAWSASTAYKAGQIVIAPDGSLQSAKVDFTSGSSFNQTNWNLFSGDGVRTWAGPGTVYGLGDLVIFSGVTYYTSIAHTSGNSFDATKFTALPASASAGNVDDLMSIAAGSVLPTPDRTNGNNKVGKFNRTERRIRFDATLPRGGRRLAVIDATSKLTASGSATVQATSTTDPLVMTSNVVEAVFTFGSQQTAKLTTPLSTTLDFTSGHLRFPVRVSSVTATSDKFCIEVSSDGFATANYHQYVINNTNDNLVTAGRWCMVSAAYNEFAAVGTGATLSAINSIRIRHQPVNPDTVTVGLAFFDYVPPVLDRALCVLWFDDSLIDFWQYAAVPMAAYGFPGVSATIPGAISTGPNPLTIGQMDVLHDFLGWQIATHAYTNTEHGQSSSTLTGDTLVSSFERSFAWIQSQGFYGYQDGSYYGGTGDGMKQFNTDQYYAVRKMLRSCRANFQGPRMAETLPPGDPWATRAYLTGTSNTFTTHWKPYVDKAIAAKGLAEFVFHNSNVNTTGPQAEFAALLAYLDANRATIEVVTKDEMWRRLDKS